MTTNPLHDRLCHTPVVGLYKLGLIDHRTMQSTIVRTNDKVQNPAPAVMSALTDAMIAHTLTDERPTK